MKKNKTFCRACMALCLACALFLCGCNALAPGADTIDDLTANVAPASLQGEVAHASAVTDFSALLTAETMKQEEENPVFSPISAYLALAMAADGAAGETLAQFDTLLGASGTELDALCAGLMQSLTGTEGSTQLSIANSVWIDSCEDLVVEEGWLSRVKAAMDAEVFSADLSEKEALDAVNAWVEEHTQGLIPNLRTEPYDENMMLVLLNALYFKAQWENPFCANNTGEDAFTPADGETVQVAFMRDWGCYRDSIDLEGVRGTILPYDDGKTAFVALLPEAGMDVRAFAATLDAQQLKAYFDAAMPQTYMDLFLPKIMVQATFPMKDALTAMGLTDAFDMEKADLSAMGHVEGAPLYIGSVLQKAKLIVDEAGTEGAAVTEVAIPSGAAEPAESPVTLRFDRPFAYAVVDLASGVPLFLGVMENPAV